MAPKADKKPAEKKPAEETKTAVAEKAPAEKKPKAGKKLPKEGGAVAGDRKNKRVKKSVETYKIYIFKMLKQKMSTGELLDIEPLELKFPFELQKQISSSLQLSNKTESYVAFKVKTTNPKKYCVHPNTVTMQAQEAPLDMQCKDKFLLQSVVTSNGVTAKDITPEMFSKEVGHVVEECKLRVVSVSPPQPPSPVAEGSEEGSSPRASHTDNNGNANSSELHIFITSAPKADKKPAEKKPAKEKKIVVAEKATAEKKPKAEKKLVKEGGAVAEDKKKKRVKKSVKTYKIYIFKVLKQKMSTGELLDIEPLELKFQFELQKQISSSLQLSNKTESYVAFKVKTMNPKKYCVRPNTVTMQAQKEAPPDMQCKDKFLLQSVVTSNRVTAKDITPEMFSKEAGHVVEERKLRVVYLSPPQPPSPVAEGSEEGSLPRASHMDNNRNANSSEVTRAFVNTDDKSSEFHIFITSAPKAEKKPAEKKPAKEKKVVVVEKATAEKKPKAGKKLPKEGGAVAGDKKKKRVKKSVETYKIYIFKVLKQKMSTGELLDIEPLELKFPFELHKQISSSLQLSNKTESYVAFEVKTTNPKKYCVRPNTGVVLPRSTCDVIVTMQAQKEAPPDMQCKDKFLLQSVVTSNGVTAKDITPEMFSKEAGHVVEECKLRVVYVSPPQPPSPVTEGSEEGSTPRASYMDNNGNANSSEVTRAFVDTHDKSSELHEGVKKSGIMGFWESLFGRT